MLSHSYENGLVRPVAFASRSLPKAEKDYSQLDREALAIVFGIKFPSICVWSQICVRNGPSAVSIYFWVEKEYTDNGCEQRTALGGVPFRIQFRHQGYCRGR